MEQEELSKPEALVSSLINDVKFWRWVAASLMGIVTIGMAIMTNNLMSQLKGERGFVISDFSQWTQDRESILNRLLEHERMITINRETVATFRETQLSVLARLRRLEEKIGLPAYSDSTPEAEGDTGG